jgi:anti-sigma B factor antagonist
MDMTVSTRKVNGVTILDLSGRIVLGDGCTMLRSLIRDLVSYGDKQILFNLRDVDYIDSSGLSFLVTAYTSVRKAGGDLKLLNASVKVRDVMKYMKLDKVFDMLVDEISAVRSFS